MMWKIRVGDEAPDVTLISSSGKKVTLKDYIGRKNIVFYFYPKDNTPGCTKEACAFRDNYEVFKEMGAEVIGVSSDSLETHQEFVKKHNLPFILLSDEEKKIRKRFSVPFTLGLIAGRVTYIIDKKGWIRYILSSQFKPTKHIVKALDALKKLEDKQAA